MSIRQALRSQSSLASRKRDKATTRWCASNVILTMMAGMFAVICAVEILHG
jgi:glycine cleavage system pyridoxal-binding protein P